jgi:hypothetical protein
MKPKRGCVTSRKLETTTLLDRIEMIVPVVVGGSKCDWAVRLIAFAAAGTVLLLCCQCAVHHGQLAYAMRVSALVRGCETLRV